MRRQRGFVILGRTFALNGVALGVLSLLVACAVEVTSPDTSLLETQEDSGLQVAPEIESVTVMDEELYTYGETVVKVAVKDLSVSNSDRNIIYDYKYIDSEGALLGGESFYDERPPSQEGNVYFTFIQPNRKISFKGLMRHTRGGQERAGVRIRVYFDDVYVSDQTSKDLGIFYETNVIFEELSSRDNPKLASKGLRYSHMFAKMYLEAGGNFFFRGHGKPVFIRRTYPAATGDRQSVSNVNTRKENTLKMYFYVGHPKGSIRGYYRAFEGQGLDETDANRITNDAIFSKWEIFKNGAWADLESANWQSDGRVVFYNGTNWVTNGGEGEVPIQSKPPPGRRLPINHEVFSRHFHYIAGTNTGSVSLRVTFGYEAAGMNEIDPVTVSFDVLDNSSYAEQIKTVYPEARD